MEQGLFWFIGGGSIVCTQLLVKSNKAAARGKKGASVTSELREEPQHFMDRPVQSA